MNDATWWNRDEAGVRVVPTDSTVSVLRALPPTGLIHSARMRGREMHDSDAVFTHFYEALRLPDCFGWNWDALRDFLTDLHWLNAKNVLVIIDDAHAVLSESPGERGILFRALKDTSKFWAEKPELPGQEKTVFQAVLLCPPEAQENMLHELQKQ
ncbi:barstar family protein [Streptomyces sp. NPDC052701]|uniref:barstar family protein n=1 Tax=Streptomyces sp. NPDC052701 TaxID=3155533 RepID=UPI00341A3491